MDAERLQSYFDRELSPAEMNATANHLAGCPDCAAAAREAQEEMALLASAFAFDAVPAVPTERLQRRLSEAIAALDAPPIVAPARRSFWGRLNGLFALNFGIFNAPPAFSYGLAGTVFAALLVGLLLFAGTKQANEQVADSAPPSKAGIVPPLPTNDAPNAPSRTDLVQNDRRLDSPDFVKVNNFKSDGRKNFNPVAGTKSGNVKLLPGEKSYLKAIIELKSTVAVKTQTLRPDDRVEYERNLAVVDQAIASSRFAAKSDPRDADANSQLLSAYQSKVELLSAVANQTQTPFGAR
ncbi:MAG TPA: anti-sigma factor [Pyrinomonadaceae bacterium]|nr:anti-sigma factor [Pyrinomonadaceae bacterium]